MVLKTAEGPQAVIYVFLCLQKGSGSVFLFFKFIAASALLTSVGENAQLCSSNCGEETGKKKFLRNHKRHLSMYSMRRQYTVCQVLQFLLPGAITAYFCHGEVGATPLRTIAIYFIGFRV